jgi:hypothetical protein
VSVAAGQAAVVTAATQDGKAKRQTVYVVAAWVVGTPAK